MKRLAAFFFVFATCLVAWACHTSSVGTDAGLDAGALVVLDAGLALAPAHPAAPPTAAPIPSGHHILASEFSYVSPPGDAGTVPVSNGPGFLAGWGYPTNLPPPSLSPGTAGQVLMTVADSGAAGWGDPNTLAVRKGQAIVKILPAGDSIMTGGSSNEDDRTTSLRSDLWNRLRSIRGGVRFLGDNAIGLFDNRAALAPPASYAPGNVMLGDWHTSSTGGYTLSQINTEATTTVGLFGCPDLYILEGGQNDIQTGIGGSLSNAVIEANVLAGIDAFIATQHAACPSAWIHVDDFAPAGVGLSTYVQTNVITSYLNPILASHLAALNIPKLQLVVSGSTLSMGSMDTTGLHPAGPQGYSQWARPQADAVLQVFGVGGQPHPRNVLERLPVPRLSDTAEATAQAYIADPSHLITPNGAFSSFSMGMLYYPTDVSAAYQRALFWTGPDVVPTGSPDGSGIWLFTAPGYSGSPQGASSLGLYIGGVAQYVNNDCLRVNTWHAISITFDNVLHEASIYCLRAGASGRAVTSLMSQVRGIPAFTMPTTARVNLGALLAINGAPGLKGDLWMSVGHVASVDEIEDWFDDGALPQATTAYYPLNEGTGTTLNPASTYAGVLPTGVIGGTGSVWSAAGANIEPWHRYYGNAAGGDLDALGMLKSISGQSGAGGTVPINASPLQFSSSVAAPMISQANAATATNPVSLTIHAQSPNGSSGTAAQNTPGSIINDIAVPGSVGTPGNEALFEVTRGGAFLGGIGYNSGGPYGLLYLVPGSTPSIANSVIFASSAATYFNTIGSGLYFAIGAGIYMGMSTTAVFPNTDLSGITSGTATQRWGTVYAQALNGGTHARVRGSAPERMCVVEVSEIGSRLKYTFVASFA